MNELSLPPPADVVTETRSRFVLVLDEAGKREYYHDCGAKNCKYWTCNLADATAYSSPVERRREYGRETILGMRVMPGQKYWWKRIITTQERCARCGTVRTKFTRFGGWPCCGEHFAEEIEAELKRREELGE